LEVKLLITGKNLHVTLLPILFSMFIIFIFMPMQLVFIKKKEKEIRSGKKYIT
jgi:hypothetical protein